MYVFSLANGLNKENLNLNLFLMSHLDVSLVNILLSITRVSLVLKKIVFCQLRVHCNLVNICELRFLYK